MDYRVIILGCVGAATLFLIYQLYFRDKNGGRLRSFFTGQRSERKVEVQKPTLEKKRIPTSGACAECDERITMPFRCKYCEKLFCSEHRLPENHDCETLKG